MYTQDFAGKNGFIWWMGVVEDRDDPLLMGRCRVRIIGWHSDNEQELPVEALPWATPILPVDNPRTTPSLAEGEWVVGYFLDGYNAQQPLIMGVVPGIVQNTTKITTQVKVAREGGSSKKGTAFFPFKKIGSPTFPTNTDQQIIGEPTVARYTRGDINRTPVAVANDKKIHVCDFSVEISRLTALARNEVGVIMQAIRNAIKTALRALGISGSPIFAEVIEKLKQIQSEIKYVRKIVREAQDFVKAITFLVQKAKAIIAYILSLPQRFLNFLRGCIQKLIRDISAGITQLFTGSGSPFGGLSELVSEIKNTVSEAQGLAKDVVRLSASATSALQANPTPAQIEAAGREIFSAVVGGSPPSTDASSNLDPGSGGKG